MVWLLALALWLAGGLCSPAASLIWRGALYLNNNWDTNASDMNWQSGIVLGTNFYNGDQVTFNNSGSSSPTVNIVGLVQPASIKVDTSAVSYTFTNVTGSITGPGALLVIGTGKLMISTTNSFTGGTTVSNATLVLSNSTAVGSGPITNSSGTVAIVGFTLPNALNCAGTAALTNSVNTGGLGVLTGNGTLAINSPGRVFDLTGDITGYGGTLALSNCTSGVRFNGTTGSSSATFDLGNGSLVLNIRNNSAGPFALGALTGGSGTKLTGNGSFAVTANYAIGGNNTSNTFSGTINNSTYPTAINKVGSGVLTLSGTNTYTGNTTVSAGVLALTGSTSLTNSPTLNLISGAVLDVSGRTDGTLTLSAGQTLAGVGTLNGSLVSGASSFVAVGLGNLTVTNVATLNGVTTLKLNRTNVITHSAIIATNFSAAGTLVVTNLGPALQAGDTFKLFNAPVGSFASVQLPVSGLDPNNNVVTYTWTNKLANDGTVQVLTGYVPSLFSTNAYLTSLVVSNNTDALTLAPGFTTNNFGAYLATNNYGSPVSVLVTNGDLTATNTLFLNGISQGAVTSGVPSLTLALGAGSNNVLAVQVVSQDLVYTNLYQVAVYQSGPPVSPNAYLTGFTLNPVVAFTPNFDSNTLSGYTATENYGVPFTVTVTNGNANAMNVLTYNGGSPVLLTNGVASGSFAMNVNPGVTNILSVVVTAQDGVTTETYAVNVVQIPSPAAPNLTSSVSSGNLVLNWDQAHTGYRLLAQTNNLSKGVSKNTNDWGSLGYNTTNTATISIVKGTNAFYRLVYP